MSPHKLVIKSRFNFFDSGKKSLFLISNTGIVRHYWFVGEMSSKQTASQMADENHKHKPKILSWVVLL